MFLEAKALGNLTRQNMNITGVTTLYRVADNTPVVKELLMTNGNRNTVGIQRVLLLSLILVSASAMADTIHMKSGVRIEGKVLRTEGGRVVVQTGPRVVRLREDEIALIEENEKDGSFDREAAKRAAAARDKELTEQYGLTGEERQWIMNQIAALTNPDPVKRGEAWRALVAKAGEKDIFAFLRDTATSSLPWAVPSLLQIMAEIDPGRTRLVARILVTNPEEHARAAAVEILGLTADTDSLVLMMRGMLDHTAVVKMGACTALAAIKAKEATPLLILRLNDADLRVEKYAREALAVIWNISQEDATAKTKADWESFWLEQSPAVLVTVDLESLEPLVPPGTRFEHC